MYWHILWHCIASVRFPPQQGGGNKKTGQLNVSFPGFSMKPQGIVEKMFGADGCQQVNFLGQHVDGAAVELSDTDVLNIVHRDGIELFTKGKRVNF